MAKIIEQAWNGIQKGAIAAGDAIAKGAVAAGDAVAKGADVVAKGAISGWNTVQNAASDLSKGAVGMVDQNGDGKFDQDDVMVILGNIYGSACNGIPNVSKPIEELANEYLNLYKTPQIAARKLIDNAVVKCTTSGFINGFGGLIVLPVTLPANVTSVLYVQMRMIAAVAYISGLEVRSDVVQTLVYACLAGVSITEVVKKAGLQFGNKLGIAMVKKIPSKVLTKINQKVGFRFLTKFGEKGIINIGKMVPVVGALIGGGFDFAETRVIGDRAYKQFMEGNFTIHDSDAIVTDNPEILNEEE